MYVPDHFRATDNEVRELLTGVGAVDLVTATGDGLLATMLPMVYDAPGSRDGIGAFGALLGHVARKNPQWQTPVLGTAMAILRGPDAYITPSWYATKREHGRVVPTWNYVVVHAHGRLRIHDDPAWLEENVRRLSIKHESERPEPWSVDDAPAPYIAGQLRAIIGVELLIDRLEAKTKLSQNRSADDIDGVIEGLVADGDGSVSEAMPIRPVARVRVDPCRPQQIELVVGRSAPTDSPATRANRPMTSRSGGAERPRLSMSRMVDPRPTRESSPHLMVPRPWTGAEPPDVAVEQP